MTLPIAQRYSALPETIVAPGKKLLSAVLDEIPSDLKPVADLVRLRTANRFHSEAVAVAERVDTDWRNIVLASVSYDMTLAMFGCSTIALATKAGPVLARNMDWWPEDLLARGTFQFEHRRNGQLEFMTAGWPGSLGVVTGMSGRGFAVALNAVTGPEGIDKSGYPVLLHLRRVIEDAKNFDDAVKMLSKTKLVAPALFTIVGTQNHERVVIERSPGKHIHRIADHGKPLVTTNDYRLLFKTKVLGDSEIYQTSCGRFNAMKDFCSRFGPDDNVEDQALLYVLTDENVLATITAQHIIFRPREQYARVLVPGRLLN